MENRMDPRNFTGLTEFTGGGLASPERMAKAIRDAHALPASARADSSYQEVSAKYKFISTQKIIQTFADAGLELWNAKETRSRKYHGFQKHTLKFKVPGILAGDSQPLILATNSHDGRGSLILQFGFYRIICANGLVVGDSSLVQTVRHTGNVEENLKIAIAAILEQTEQALIQRREMLASKLLSVHQVLLAAEALKLRGIMETNHNISQLLQPRRDEDNHSSAWNTFNVIQENLIRGGFEIETMRLNKETGESAIATRQLRAISGNEMDRKLNAQLWELAHGAALDAA